MRDAVDYLFNLSDPELVLYWQAFGEFPTKDRQQRARLAAAAERAVRENVPCMMSIPERTPTRSREQLIEDQKKFGGKKNRTAAA